MKKKNAATVKVTKDYLADGLQAATDLAELNILRDLKKVLPKGWIPCTPIKYTEGNTGDDFARNMFTVIGQRFILRAPRILSRRYYRKNNYRKFGSMKTLY